MTLGDLGVGRVTTSRLNRNGQNETNTFFFRRIEQSALDIRKQAQVASSERFEPTKAKKKLKFVIAKPEEVWELLGSANDEFLKRWSGASEELPDKRLFIMLNPSHTIERNRVTVLEEVAHKYYGHKPAKFTSRWEYEYNDEQEEEAYQTAAAVLLPMEVIGKAVWRAKTAEEIAAKYGTSIELVEMRIKRLNLWPEYKKRVA